MMKHAKMKFQWRLTSASSALSAAAVTKGELKARPSHPLRGPRLALHSQPAAAAHRLRCETPPRPLTGRLLIGSLRSTITRRSERAISRHRHRGACGFANVLADWEYHLPRPANERSELQIPGKAASPVYPPCKPARRHRQHCYFQENSKGQGTIAQQSRTEKTQEGQDQACRAGFAFWRRAGKVIRSHARQEVAPAWRGLPGAGCTESATDTTP